MLSEKSQDLKLWFALNSMKYIYGKNVQKETLSGYLQAIGLGFPLYTVIVFSIKKIIQRFFKVA